MHSASELTAYLESQRDHQEALLAELVRTPSDNPPGDGAALAERARALLEGLGLAVEAHAVPESECRAAGRVHATNLIVRERFGPGPTLALCAPGDAPPPGEGWTADPYGAEVRDGWMLGCGVGGSKCDIATYAFAVLALRDAGLTHGTVELHITADQETGGELGPRWLLARGLTRPQMALCAGSSYTVATTHSGCLRLALTFTGVAAPAAAPELGRDALEAAMMLLGALYAQRRSYAIVRSATPGIGSPTLVAGCIEGGTSPTLVPSDVTIQLARQILPEESPARVERELTAFIERTASLVPGVACYVRRVLLASPLRPLPGTERLAAVVQHHASDVLAEAVPVAGVPLCTDARHYAEAGIPTVLYGAGARTLAEAHVGGPDERLRLDDLAHATRVVALAAGELLETGG